MGVENAVYIIALFIASVITGALALHASRGCAKTGVRAFMCLIAAITVYSLGYAFELSSTTLTEMLFWSKIEYIGISVLPAFWIIMAVQYVGKDRWLTRPVVFALFVIPAITFILHCTDSYHHLYYSAASVNTDGPFPLLSITKGPFYWVHTSYINLSLLCGNILFLQKRLQTATVFRRQITVMLTGSLIPWAVFIIYLSGKGPRDLDLVPFGFAFAGLIFAWGLFRYGLFDLAPIARDFVFEGMRDGVMVLDEQNRIIDFNPAAQKIVQNLSVNDIGNSAEEVLKHYPELENKISSNEFGQAELKITQGGQLSYYNFRLWPVKNRRNRLIGKTVVLTNTTEQVLLLDKMRILANFDNLTKIFNRSYFLELSQEELSRAKRYQLPVSIIIMDIDHFKWVNDTYGHKAGDLALQTVAGVCKEALRANDLFGRYGGEEFVVFLPVTSPEMALSVAERLRKNVSCSPVLLDNYKINVTASFGVFGVENAEGVELDDLLKNADHALYKAKSLGRNCVMLAGVSTTPSP